MISTLAPFQMDLATLGAIAFDVDRTVLIQPPNGDLEFERQQFYRDTSHELNRCAERGMNLAFVTGNSLRQLSRRVLKWTVESLVRENRAELINRFHFFSTGAGIYLHIPKITRKLTRILQSEDDDLVTSTLFDLYADPSYYRQTQIELADIDVIQKAIEDLVTELGIEHTNLEIQLRGPRLLDATSQIPVPIFQVTLKPISNKESRLRITAALQQRLSDRFGHKFCVRPAGRTSIDVTLHFLDKSHALRWLINHLRIQGNQHLGEPFGANLLYFGDEVTLGTSSGLSGNDFPVSRIEGVMVMAVDPSKQVPLRPNILVPTSHEEGPTLTCQILRQFNDTIDQQRALYRKASEQGLPAPLNAVQAFKSNYHAARIRKKIADTKNFDALPSDVLQVIDMLVALASRDSSAARQIVRTVNQTIDDLLLTVQREGVAIGNAIGMSVEE